MGQNKSGRRFAAASMVLALVALAVAPAVFDPLGILMVAVSKGERYLGMLGLTASAILAVTDSNTMCSTFSPSASDFSGPCNTAGAATPAAYR
ncbi:MAG: hypothetical protein NZ810_08600 [Dehalococcoidia bacterium]|nr:hypothetical protein [Dehalococcoidia bacterium]